MLEEYEQFQRFKSALRSVGSEDRFLLGEEKGFTIYYVPFEHINVKARLVLVGITPGPTQRDCSRATAQRLLATPAPNSQILKEILRQCAFTDMRERIDRMLDHFGIPRCLGIDCASRFWSSCFDQFFPTSIIPNAAFKNGLYFNGPFNAILEIAPLRHQFEDVFIPSIRRLNKQALYLGLGPVVDKALRLCASRNIIEERQIIGYLPHASPSSGSQFAYFMREKELGDLNPRDPVRHRARDLDVAYERIKSNLDLLFPRRPRDP
jgi:hypothetical protein